MLIIRGANIYPSAVETVLRRVEGLGPEFEILVDRVGALDEITVRVELTAAAAKELDVAGAQARERLTQQTEHELKHALQIRTPVELIEPGTLPADRLQGAPGRRPARCGAGSERMTPTAAARRRRRRSAPAGRRPGRRPPAAGVALHRLRPGDRRRTRSRCPRCRGETRPADLRPVRHGVGRDDGARRRRGPATRSRTPSPTSTSTTGRACWPASQGAGAPTVGARVALTATTDAGDPAVEVAA